MNPTKTFLLRWKGQQLGPFTRELIEQKVRDRELSLAHEIQLEGKWRPLRSFLNLQAQSQEQERQKIRLKRMQDDLDDKQVELQDTKAQLEEVKKAPAISLRPPSDSTTHSPQSPALAGPKSNNPIDRLKEHFRRKR